MNPEQFLNRAWSGSGPKVVSGFSRPFYHNLAGILHGHKFGKRAYGGMMRHTEAAMLYRWARQLPAGSTILEIGCYGGLSASYLAAGVKGTPSRVYAIDPFDSDLGTQAALTDHKVALENKPSRELVKSRLAQFSLDDYVELIEGYSQDIAKTWDKPIDFLWIDGNHEQAWQDYLDFRSFLKPGARVAVHDAHPRYGYDEVVRDVRKIFADGEWTQFEHVKSIITAVKVR